MRSSFIRNFILLFGLLFFFAPIVTLPLHADDDVTKKTVSSVGSSTPPSAKETPKRAEGSLTEREQMLLDRVEQLEKRVEELEAKDHAGSSPASELATGTKGISTSPPTGSVAAGTAVANSPSAAIASSLGSGQPIAPVASSRSKMPASRTPPSPQIADPRNQWNRFPTPTGPG